MSAVTKTYQRLHDMVNRTVPEALEQLDGDKEGLAQLLALHRQLIAEMRIADDVIQAKLIEAGVDYGGEHIDGAGFVRIFRKGKKVRYDNDAVISRLAAALSDQVGLPDRETGEYKPIPVMIEEAVRSMAELTGATTPSYNSWRKTKAARLGIPIEKYSEEEGGTLAVVIER